MHPGLGVGTVWRGINAGGGWNCLPVFGKTQGMHKSEERLERRITSLASFSVANWGWM